MLTRTLPDQWKSELNDFIRAFSGAFLFGTPLIYTMEMWDIGTYLEPWKLYVYLGLSLILNLVLNYFAGFKQENHPNWRAAINQTVDVVAVGAVASTVMLLVLSRMKFGDPPGAMLGQIIIQTVPLSIGASLANVILAGRGDKKDGPQNSDQTKRKSAWHLALNDFGATATGGIFIGFSIAPTEEVPTIAVEMSYFNQLALIGLSLLITYAIVFASGFDPQGDDERNDFLQNPFTETVMAYVLSLFVALVMLALFNQLSFSEPISLIISKILVLGVPVSIGGAAGRLAI